MYICAPTLEAAAPTVFMIWLHAWKELNLNTEENMDLKEFLLENKIITICEVPKMLGISFE
jgi:hypothetical protein